MPRNARRPRACAESLEGRRLLAGDAGSLIYNVNQTTDSLGPDDYVNAGSVGCFSGQGLGGTGRELWRTDGTAAGTYRVKDVQPGVQGSSPTGLTMVGDVLYFAADDGVNGVELWRSDGTEAGTLLVQNIRDAGKGSNPRLLTAVGDTLYFVADGTLSGNPRLWRLRDAAGPAGGTAEVVPGQPADGATPAPSSLIAYNGGLLFAANNGLHRVADPAAATTLVAAVTNTAPSFDFRLPVRVGGQVYFTAGGTRPAELWRTDGTPEGTARVTTVSLGPDVFTGIGHFVASGDRLYFLAQNLGSGSAEYQLWRSDGTAAGTVPLGGLGFGSGSPASLTPIGERSLVFRARTAAAGAEPWVTDGTPAGTHLLAEFLAGPADGWAAGGDFVRAGDRWFAPGVGTFGAPQLWVTDGTPAGTTLVREVDEAGAFVLLLGELGGRLLFSGGGLSYFQGDLFASDGTAAGTVRVGSADRGSGSSMFNSSSGFGDATFLSAGGGVAYFAAADGSHGAELWRANPAGAAVAAEMVADLSLGGTGSDPVGLTLGTDGSVYFSATASGLSSDRGLYRLPPGGGGGTPQRIGFDGTSPDQITPFGSVVYFTGRDPAGTTRLYRYDAATAAAAASRVAVGGRALAAAGRLTAAGPYLYFVADDGTSGTEPWRTDGTAAGTVLLRDVALGTASSLPDAFTAVGATVYFNAVTPASGRELWKTDGTPAGTVLAAELTPGSASTTFDAMRGFGGALYFAGASGLVRYAEAGGTYATTTATSALGARRFVDGPDGALYFIAGQTATTQAVYRTDGSAANTARLSGPGTAAADPTFIPTTLLTAGGRVWVAGRTGTDSTTYKVELWVADLGAATATKVRDLAPTVVGSIYLSGFYLYGRETLSADDQFLYFPAYTPEAGVEPYRMPLTSPATVHVVSTTVDDASAQRSQVRTLTVRFDRQVTLAANVLTLARHNTGGSGANDGSAPTDASAALAAPTTPDGGLTWVYTFVAGAFTEANGSLKDGVYTMTVNPAGVSPVGGGIGLAASATLTFHRKFGDQDGTKVVNNADYLRFRTAFGTTAGGGGGAYNSIYDFDGNGTINNLDYLRFRSRFGTTFTY